MTWRVFLGIGQLLCGVVLTWMLFRRPSSRRVATILSNGQIAFSPNRLAYLAWPLTIVLLAWTATKDLTQSQGRPFGLITGCGYGLVAVSLFFSSLDRLSSPLTVWKRSIGLEDGSVFNGRTLSNQHRQEEPHGYNHGRGWYTDRPLYSVARSPAIVDGTQESLRGELASRFSPRAIDRRMMCCREAQTGLLRWSAA